MGRHRRRVLRDLTREPLLLILVVAAIVIGSTVAIRAVNSEAAAPQATCSGQPLALKVGIDDSANRWLGPLARSYNDAHRKVGNTCVNVQLRTISITQAEQALQPVPFPGGGTPPDVWIPESSTALDLVRGRAENAKVLPATGSTIATSPIVLAGPAEAVRALGKALPADRTATLSDLLTAAQNPAGWGQKGIDHAEWGRMKFAAVDPNKTALGASLLVAAAAAAAGTPPGDVSAATFSNSTAQRGLLGFVRALTTVAPSADDLLAQAIKQSSSTDLLTKIGMMALYESDVWRYDGESPPVLLEATYPLGGSLAADFPFVVPNASWVDGPRKAAAEDFRKYLLGADVQNLLGSYGLRRADGSAGPELTQSDRGIRAALLAPQPANSPAAALAARSAWRLVTQRISLLAVIDVSGSMEDPVPGTGRNKLDLTRAAATASLPLFDPRDKVGLWEFSTELGPNGEDYRQLVPLGPAAGKVGGGATRIEASIAAYQKMTPRGATGLYDTILAAYKTAVDNYTPNYINGITIITDGKNEDTSGIDLDTLLRELKSRYSTEKPVHIVAIAYGTDADPATLGRIAKVTDGISFTSPDPKDIGKVFLTAISAVTG